MFLRIYFRFIFPLYGQSGKSAKPRVESKAGSVTLQGRDPGEPSVKPGHTWENTAKLKTSTSAPQRTTQEQRRQSMSLFI